MNEKLAPERRISNIKSRFWQVVAVVLTGSPALVHAQTTDPALCNSTGCHAKIDRLVVNATSVYIGSTADEAPLGCTPLSGVYMVLKKAHTNYDAIYAGLLASQVSNRAVVIRTIDRSNPCEVDYVEFRK